MDLSKNIVNDIMRDLTDRKGLRQTWEQIDEEIQDEIREKWESIIVEELRKSKVIC